MVTARANLQQMDNTVQAFVDARSSLPPVVLIAKPPITTVFKGKRCRAVWNRVWIRPLQETDHEFYVFLLGNALGKEWDEAEQAKSPVDRHVLMGWFDEMDRERSASRPNQEAGHWDTDQTGGITELLTLGRDIYDLTHTRQLPVELLGRLRNAREYQGARYEIAVAGAFARAGFKITWTKPGPEKRCEFIADNAGLGESIAVEAKSRHREGVLHEPVTGGGTTDFYTEIARLVRQVEEQLPENSPTIACIDLNLPPNHSMFSSNQEFVERLKGVMDRLPEPTPENPSRLTATFFTNFAWHYQAGERSGGSSVVTVIPLYARVAVRNGMSLALLDKALNEHAKVPNLNPGPSEATWEAPQGTQ